MGEHIASGHRLGRGLLLAILGLVVLGCDEGDPVVTQPLPGSGVDSAPALIQGLEDAYLHRDYDKLQSLISDPTRPGSTQPQYTFFLADPNATETSWNAATEVRIHRRMFKPLEIPAGETPVSRDLWILSVDIRLVPQTEFVEQTGLYTSPSNPDGLDPVRWTATEATYGTYVFLQTAGNTDYLVNGRANFVVIEDKTKSNGDPGKWLLYRWQDLGRNAPKPPWTTPATGDDPLQSKSWTALKELFLK